MLVQLKGMVINKAKYPTNLSTDGFECDQDFINLLLGAIEYDSLNYPEETQIKAKKCRLKKLRIQPISNP